MDRSVSIVRTNTNDPPSTIFLPGPANLTPPTLFLLGQVDEPSSYISSYELNAHSISDIESFKPPHQLSFDRRVP